MAKNNVSEWSVTPGENLDLGGISINEGWLPSTVNNAKREEVSQIRKWWADPGGVNTVAGTANAVTVTTPTLYTALISGIRVTFKAGSTNTAATTLNLDAIGAKKVRKISGGTDVALAAGDILAGHRHEVLYDSTADAAAGAFILLNPSVLVFEPAFPTVGGTANALTLTPTHAVTAYTTGDTYTFTVASNSTAIGYTLNVSGLGAKTINTYSGGFTFLYAGQRIQVVYDAAFDSGSFVMVDHQPQSGTYVPVLTNTTNVASSSAFTCQYVRILDNVIVSGRVDIDVTASGAATVLGMSLPIASNFAAGTDLGGAGAANATANAAAGINADSTNDRAQFSYFSTTTANQAFFFTFTYRILA